MDDIIENLNSLVTTFLEGNLNADSFERQFTQMYDFSDFDIVKSSNLAQVREVLEHYSFSETDVKNYPEYYIDENSLREKIRVLKASGV